jgi:glycosyltransferase involved in cell wall biosynthesis
VLSVGRNHITKGYDLGIRVFANISGRFENACYVIVGRGTTKLASLLTESNMEDRVRLVEQVPMSEIPYIYHSADIFFNPSLMEGFAQVNAQALASGLPCVLTDAPGNGDAGDYGGAVIAKTADIESMAEKLTLLLEDSDLRRELGREAHAASKRYSWGKIAEEYLDVFERLVMRNRAMKSYE